MREMALLVKLEALAASAPETQVSEESRGKIWTKDDRVLQYYVIVRHFTSDHFGAHVGLAAAVQTEVNGEQHFYRLPPGTLETEHVGVYVFNPGCRQNGALAFEVVRARSTSAVVVAPDACVLVHTIGVVDMRGVATVSLTQKSGFRVRMSFVFEK
jgi:hypothetical protein